jgi:transketolase
MMKVDQEEATEVEVLLDIARKVRRRTLALISEAGYGFLGPCFSCVDLIVCLGFSAATQCFATDSNDHANLILSKGHAAAALYAAWAEHDGDCKQEEYAEFGSPLQAHPNSSRLPRVMVSSGSVGQAIPVAVGLALAEKLQGRRNRTYVLTGDGELQAGVVWEGLIAASHQKPQPNLVVIIDANGFQSAGRVPTLESTKSMLETIVSRFVEIDGNDISQVLEALNDFGKHKGLGVIWCSTRRGAGLKGFNDEWPMSTIGGGELVAKWLRDLEDRT